ncbi:FG-GAP-like repeat-containing protein [Microvirga solisilvae]|uniref:FG-GAP-like repeat-containing protein n=1 Tax=Microvirga solisilvae TaxID=2919498 RepID=UPI001FAF8044|nr:FG-GAP-like repeat-containing protein [Microvirga solisilvae]
MITKSPSVTSVGLFRFTTFAGDQINSGYHFGDLDGDGRLDMVIGGWAYGSDPTGPDNAATRLLVLKQDASGGFTEFSGLSGTVIAGTWQPLIADFNGDGRGDIGIAGFTDFPVTPVRSTFLMSGASGYTRVDYEDRIAAHGANLADINGDGLMDVVTATYSAIDLATGAPRTSDQYFLGQNGANPIAVWNTPDANPVNRSPGGSAVAAGDLDNDGYVDFVIGDAIDTSVPLFDEHGYFQRADILVMKGNGTGMVNGTKVAKITPYFETHHDGLSPIDFGDGSKFQETYSHDVRTMIADFDGDGLNDILTLSTNYSLGENASSIRIYKNQGSFNFTDMTENWLPEYQTTWAADYSLQVRDFDGNGTIDLAIAAEGSSTGHGNAIFLNDGSGRLHLAIRDEYLTWANTFQNAAKDVWLGNIPRFIPYLTANGTVNFQVLRDNVFLSDGTRSSIHGTLSTNINFHNDFTTAITATGTAGGDRLTGWAGNDTLLGLAGADTLNGGSGSDTASYARAAAGVTANLSNSAANTGDAAGDQYISIENLLGSSFADVLVGDGGKNILNGGAGNDYLEGGLGDDIYYVDSAGDQVVETATIGNADTVYTTISYTLGAYVERLFAQGSATISLIGNDLNNTVTGNAAANTLYSQAGNDTLNGGAGADRMDGGIGNDTYYVDNAGDRVVETKAGGTADTVYSSVGLTLASYVERLYGSGAGAITLNGNSLSNTITGNTGNNRINAGSGNDTINGGLGNDRLTGGSGSDKFVFSTALNKRTNVDTITDFSVKYDTVYLENAIFTKVGKNGALKSGCFWIGTKAHDSSDRIIYDSKSGALYYDPDGFGRAAQTKFVQLAKGLQMTSKDFFVI